MVKSFSTVAADKLTAQDILGIDENAPELLFENDEKAIKSKYRALSKIWHTDKAKGDPVEAEEVFKRVSRLRDVANERFKAGTWKKPGEMLVTDVSNGKKFKIHYMKQKDFELGEMYISDNFVTYALRKENKDLFDNAKRVIGSFKFANDGMKKEFSRGLPEIKSAFETDDRFLLIIKKDPKMILLSDVCDYFAGKMDAKHVAWIGSALHNIACYLSYTGIVHNAFSTDNFFIDPEGHIGAMLGGWFYGAQPGAGLTALPPNTVRVVPPHVLATGRADPQVDLILLRDIGRTLLADRAGMRLGRDKDVPKAMADWLTLPPSANAFEDYKIWQTKVLPDSFGVRRFVELKVTARDVYKP